MKPATAAPPPSPPPSPVDPGINGAVEQVQAGGEFRGWARERGSDRPLRIAVLHDGREIGVNVTDVARPDIGGPFGFRVACSETVLPADILTGRLRIVASTIDGRAAPLRVVDTARTAAVFDAIRGLTDTLGEAELDALVKALANSPVMEQRRAAFAALSAPGAPPSADVLPLKQAIAALPPNPKRTGLEASVGTLGVPVGLVSPDGSAMVGFDGYVFLVSGANGLLTQYALDPAGAQVRSKVAQWLALIAERARLCETLGVGFIQVMIPEKLTALSDRMPHLPRVPTPIWSGVEAGILADARLAPRYVSALPLLRRLGEQNLAFPRIDTHLTGRAAFELFCEICAAMGSAAPYQDVPFNEELLVIGDLAERIFPGVRLPEIHYGPPSGLVATWPKPDLVERKEPGRQSGTRYVWHTPDAPLPGRVVAFGNSFFERGASARSLSWWFARTFREFHFCWSPEMDADYIRQVSPDWVICQSIERFMPQVPAR